MLTFVSFAANAVISTAARGTNEARTRGSQPPSEWLRAGTSIVKQSPQGRDGQLPAALTEARPRSVCSCTAAGEISSANDFLPVGERRADLLRPAGAAVAHFVCDLPVAGTRRTVPGPAGRRNAREPRITRRCGALRVATGWRDDRWTRRLRFGAVVRSPAARPTRAIRAGVAP
jgi:hypothetical protein